MDIIISIDSLLLFCTLLTEILFFTSTKGFKKRILMILRKIICFHLVYRYCHIILQSLWKYSWYILSLNGNSLFLYWTGWSRIISFHHTFLLQRSCWCIACVWHHKVISVFQNYFLEFHSLKTKNVLYFVFHIIITVNKTWF